MNMKKIISVLLIFCLISVPVCSDAASDFDRTAYYNLTMEEYKNADLSDPQLISDAEFFGVWNGSGWTSEPYFDYDKFEGLAPVEKAAKSGDYETCKTEILKYYREKYKTIGFANTPPTNITDTMYARYEAMMDNFYGTVHGRILFGKTAGWSSMNVIDVVRDAVKNSSGNLMLQFAASKKDGYMAVIDAKESGYVPYVKLKVNGVTKRYMVVADTYVSAETPNGSMGASEKLYAEESVASVDIRTLSDRDGVELRNDPYRKVPVMQFSLSDLSSSDNITEATLYLHGQMVEAVSPGGIRVESDRKSLFALTYNTTATVNEQTLNYNTWKQKCDYMSWSGENGPGFLVAPDGREAYEIIQSAYQFIDQLSLGYLATGDEDFAFHLLRVYMEMIRQNGTYEQMLNRSVNSADGDAYWHGPFWFANKATFCAAQYTKRYINSKTLTPEIWTALLKDHWNTGHYLANVWLGNEEKGNFGSMAARGLADISMCYPEFREAQEPLSDEYFKPEYPGSRLGGWIAVAAYRLEKKSFSDIFADGSCVESSNAYLIQILNDLTTPMRTAQLVGTDYKPYYTKKLLEQIKKGAMFLMDNTTPWFGDWQFGDGDPNTVDYSSKLGTITQLVDDSNLEYFASKRASGEEPSYTTKVWDSAAKANFRNGWETSSVAAHLENSNNPSHGHNDDLHLSLAAYGKYLLVDPLEVNYNVALPAERWLSSTRAHNTVEINNTTAKGGRDYRTAGVSTSNTALTDYFGDVLYYPPNSPWESVPGGYPVDYAGNGVGDMHSENRDLNSIYDFVRAETFGYENHGAMKDNYEVVRDTLFLKKGYFIVTDYIKPTPKTGTELQTKSNTYKQLWHFLPDANMTVNENENIIRTNFANEPNLIVATVDDGSITPKEKTGLYGVGKPNFVEAKYGYFEKSASGTSTFNTLLYPTKAGKTAEVATENLTLDVSSETANAFSAEIVADGSVTGLHYYTLFDKTKQTSRLFGDYTTDGEMAFSETENETQTTAILRGGTFLLDNKSDRYLIYSSEKLSDLGVCWTDNKINIAYDASEVEVDLYKLTIAAEESVSEVVVNGVSVPFTQKGSYVYFGAEPVLSERLETFNEIVSGSDTDAVIEVLNSKAEQLSWTNISSGSYTMELSGVKRENGDYALGITNQGSSAHHGEQLRVLTNNAFSGDTRELTLSFDMKLDDLNTFRDIRMYYNASVSSAASMGLWRFRKDNSTVQVADSVSLDVEIAADEWHNYKISQQKISDTEYQFVWYLDGVEVYRKTVSSSVTPNQYMVILWQDTAAEAASLQLDNFRMYCYQYPEVDKNTLIYYPNEAGWKSPNVTLSGANGSIGKLDNDRFLQFNGGGSATVTFDAISPNAEQDIIISVDMKAQDVYNKRFFKLNGSTFVEWNAVNTMSILGADNKYFSKGENITKLNQWHRYIIRLSAKDGKQYFYVDGTLIDERALLFTNEISSFTVAQYTAEQKTQLDNFYLCLCSAEDAEKYCTEDKSLFRNYDFEGIAPGTNYYTNLKVLSNNIFAESGMFYTNVSAEQGNTENIVNAGYGKAADDYAMYLYNLSNDEQTDAALNTYAVGYSMEKMYLGKYFSPDNPKISASSVVRSGVSLRFTEDSFNSDKEIIARIYPDANTDTYGQISLITIAAETGRVSVCGTESDIYVLPGKWYRFDFEFDVADGKSEANRISVYLDGKLQTQDPVELAYSSNGDNLVPASTPMTLMDFYVEYQETGAADGIYLDDFVFEYLPNGSGSAINSETLTTVNTDVYVGKNGFITLLDNADSGITISEIFSMLPQLSCVKSISGVEMSVGEADGSYAVQKRSIWPEIYYGISDMIITEKNDKVSAQLPYDGNNAVLVLGIYQDDKLLRTAFDEYNDGALKAETTLSAGESYKVFLWDSLKSLVPYYEAVTGER